MAAVASLATVVGSSAAFAATIAPDDTRLVTVTSASQDASTASTHWVEQAYDCNDTDPNAPFLTPDQGFQNGPATPVLGTGSHVMRTTQFTGDTELFRTAIYDGTYATDIQHLSYATFAAPRSGTAVKQPAYLRLSFDTNGDTTPDVSLYYEPSINHPNDITQSTNGTWQTWVTTDPGEQWSIGGGQDPSSLTTLQDWANNNPTARIENTAGGSAGGVSFIAGCSGQTQNSGTFGVDAFGIETTSDTGAHADAAPAHHQLVDFEGPSLGATTSTVKVTAASPHGWNAAAYNDTDVLSPNQSMVAGPGDAPVGYGSHKFTADQNRVELFRSTELDGVRIGNIRNIDYWTYDQPDAGNPNPQQPAYLRLSVDSNGDGTSDDALYYEPSINHPSGIADNTWQHWRTGGELWSIGGGQSPSDLTTLAGYASHHPKAVVKIPADSVGTGGLAVIVGGAGVNQDHSSLYVDGVRVRYFKGVAPATDKTFDFEPTPDHPTIAAPHTVTGVTTVNVHGRAVPNTTVSLHQRNYGGTWQTVASTTSGADGSYAFSRTVRKETRFFVRNEGVNSPVAVTEVRIKVTLTTSSPSKGRLRMHVDTNPAARGETARFYRVFADGHQTLLATVTTNRFGRATVTVDAPSGRTVTVMATVTPPPGNLRGISAKVRQVIL